jgi:hypothetical protein
MTSPTYRHRIKCELIDRARLLIATSGDHITSRVPGRKTYIYRLFTHQGVSIRCEQDGFIKITAPGKRRRRQVISCPAKAYRFGRDQGDIKMILRILDDLRSLMVLDDLAQV